jgi:HK97 family phage portal protein
MIFDRLFQNSKGEYVNILDVIFGSGDKCNYIYTLAEAHAIDLIAKTIAKTEVKTYEKIDKKIQSNKGELYWTLNLQPNPNEKGMNFKYKLAVKLMVDKHALVLINDVGRNTYLFVADSFKTDKNILYGKKFTDIVLADDEGNSLSINKTYDTSNAIYYSLENKGLSKASNDFMINASKILRAAQKTFIQSNTTKWRLKHPGKPLTMIDQETGQPISYEDYKKKITDGLLTEEDAIVMLSELFEVTNLNKDINKDSSDYEKAVRNIGSTVANKWNIPQDIFFGSKTEKSTGTNDFITFAVDPYFNLLEDGFNVSLVGKEDYLKGEYVGFDKFNITHKDILESASGIDKLTGAKFSRNEINELLGLPRIDEDWANEHNLTKNYGKVEGGVENEG